MELSLQEHRYLVSEIARETGAKQDGGGKNLIVPRCPFCGKTGGKFGIYIGKGTSRRTPFMSHCFSCGASTRTLEQLLEAIGRMDLMVTRTADISAPLELHLTGQQEAEELDDSLTAVSLPDFYKRTFLHPYLQKRGFCFDDYEYFPVGTTGKLNPRYADYVLFPVIDEGETVGYVARHTWPKEDIDAYNRKARHNGEYKILRYRNSTGNDFSKLLYNYDAIRTGETGTVILTEGVFDTIALTRKLELYDNPHVAAIATFGKKISDVQIYKLQCKGVGTVVVGYDGDAVTAVKQTAERLKPYFDVLVADMADARRDWDELTGEEIQEIFSRRLQTVLEYKLNKVQEK
jgi:DNA primase